MNAHVRWAGEPDTCRCGRVVVGSLEETLGCPGLWRALPDGRWVHVLGRAA